MHEHSHFEHLLHSVDVIDATVVISIAWFSFLMSWHCAGMCGPLACAKFSRKNSKLSQSALYLVLYNSGRVLSYVLLGLVVAAFAESVSDALPLMGRVLTVALAAGIALNGILLMIGREISWAPKVLVRITRRLGEIANGFGGFSGSFVFGLLTVLLPCMTLSSALAAAAMTEEIFAGGLVMFGFALGTLPVMFALPLTADFFTNAFAGRISIKWLRRIAGFFLIVVSAITFLRLMH